MPVNLLDLMSKRERSVVVKIGESPDDTLTVRYRPDNYTKTVEAELNAANEKQRFAEGAFGLINSMVVSWDLTSDGKPYEVNPQNVEAVGFPIAKLIADAINADFVSVDTKKG